MGRVVFFTAYAVVLCKGREAIKPEMFVCFLVHVGELKFPFSSLK